MLIANKKKKENIAEYILYMFQVEDLVRALNFNLDKLEQHVFGSFTEDNKLKNEIREWYSNIIQMMELEQIKKKGHLQIVNNIILDLEGIHKNILTNHVETEYIKTYQNAAPNIIMLAEKMKKTKEQELNIMFDGLYAVMLMRLSKKEVSKETQAAIDTFSNLLALLAKKYHERDNKERTEWMG